MLRRAFVLCFFGVLSLVRPASAAVPPGQATLFHQAEHAWGVGTVSLGKPLTFRDGKLLVFPAIFEDLLWAPNGTRPRNMMLVYVPGPDDKDKPVFNAGDKFFAPIGLLPPHAYWKDNLPLTRRHEVAGGQRNVFRGEQIAEVRKLLGDYLAARDRKGADRWTGEVSAVAAALGSSIAVVREDAVRYLSAYPNLGRDFDAKALPPVTAYLSGSAPAAEKATLIDALASAKLTALKPALTELAGHDDAAGAAARRGLERLGQ